MRLIIIFLMFGYFSEIKFQTNIYVVIHVAFLFEINIFSSVTFGNRC